MIENSLRKPLTENEALNNLVFVVCDKVSRDSKEFVNLLVLRARVGDQVYLRVYLKDGVILVSEPLGLVPAGLGQVDKGS